MTLQNSVNFSLIWYAKSLNKTYNSFETMKIIRNIVFLFAIVLACSYGALSQTVSPALEIISHYPKVRDFTMSPDGNEAYFTLQSPYEEISAIAIIRKKNGKWKKAKLAEFSGKYRDLEASLSPDGLTLYFASNRPLEGDGDAKKDMDIWHVKRRTLKGDWSKPINMGSPINTSGDEFYPSVAANKNLYFTKEKSGPKGKPDIMFSGWNGSNYTSPVPLPNAINTDSDEYNAYVAPDESFLIFGGYRRKDGLGSGDMYISYRDEDGNWSKAKNMGKGVNSRYMDYCPFVDWKTKTLYFTSRRSSVTPKEFGSLEAFNREIFKYENGFSRIYRISIKELMKR